MGMQLPPRMKDIHSRSKGCSYGRKETMVVLKADLIL